MDTAQPLKRAPHVISFWFCLISLAAMPSRAELIDRGNGLIYDTVQDLTWTQNAGMFAGSWDAANTWAQNLVYGGFDDWRLPTSTQFDDPTCSPDIRNAGDYNLFYEHRAGCTGGEMEMLTALYDPWTNPIFQNLNRTRYWTATPYRDGTDPCINYPNYDVPCNLATQPGDQADFFWQWGFTGFKDSGGPYNNVAFKTTLNRTSGRYAWAVRDGDVIATILPGDMNFDGQVDTADYLLLTRFVVDPASIPTADELEAGDLNLNGQLDAGDMVVHSRTILGLI